MLLKEIIYGQDIVLETGDYYFSPKGIDRGTQLMLSKVQVTAEDKVLDLGCGYGVVGISIGKVIGGERVVMSDYSEEAFYFSVFDEKIATMEGNTLVAKKQGKRQIMSQLG